MTQKKTPLSPAAKKKLTERARKDNIAEAERRRPAKAPEPKKPETEEEKLRKEEIRKRLKKLHKKEDEKLKDLPYFVLRPMKHIPFEEDHYLKDIIYEELRRQAKEEIRKKGDQKRETLRFTHCKACPREVYFDFFEPWEARPPAPKAQLFKTDGTVYHKYIQRMLEDLGVVRESEGYLTLPGIPSNGYYDGLIPVGQEGKWLICDILEIKRKMPTACDSPTQDDYDQGQLYLSAADESERLKLCRIKVRALRLLYSDRALMTEDGFYGFISQRDASRIKEIRKYMSFLWDVVVGQKKLVVHPYSRDSRKCNTFCPYTERCWKKHKPKVEPRDLADIEMPDESMALSAAQKFYELQEQIEKLRKEAGDIKPMIEAYMLHQQIPFIKIEDDGLYEKGLKAMQPRSLFWHDKKRLIEKIGVDAYLDLSDVDEAAVNEMVHEHFIDMGIFEDHRRYKIKSMTIKKARRKKNEQ